jgi:hypothetical protein
VPLALIRLQAIGMLTLEPERLKNRLTTTRKRSPEMERGSSAETLKRLAILVSQPPETPVFKLRELR